eukprot:gene15682-21788_t
MSLTAAVDQLCAQLRQRTVEGSMPCAKKTAEILRVLVTQQRYPDASSLIDDVRFIGQKLQAAKPVELAIGNIVRRVLHIIREEQQQDEVEKVTQENESAAVSMQHDPTSPKELPDISSNKTGMLSQAFRTGPGARAPVSNRNVSLSNLLDVGIEDLDQLMAVGDRAQKEAATPIRDMPSTIPEASETSSVGGKREKTKKGQWVNKQNVIESINELIDELENMESSITVQGVEHIHANEVILTFGMSGTTFQFLKEASKKREFQVVVSEGAPSYEGHKMARKLADAGIQTTAIADAAVFAMMARANKVLVGAHAVLANGGVIAPVGIHLVALAAKQHSIPFVVLVGLHKLSPLFPHDPDVAYNEFKSPKDIVDFNVMAEAMAYQEAPAESSSAASNAPDPSTSRRSPVSAMSKGGTSKPTFETIGGSLVHAPNPAFDYIPPHLVSLFITDTGGYTPSYVYRLLTEYYSREDYLLSKQLTGA